jgi:hypothetical protein
MLSVHQRTSRNDKAWINPRSETMLIQRTPLMYGWCGLFLGIEVPPQYIHPVRCKRFCFGPA